jgi:hypothetical protein
MNQDSSPITPPPELVQQWFLGARAMPVDQWVTDVATQAARWGADQELEACCEWLASQPLSMRKIPDLRFFRRPKSASLKDQAKQAWLRFMNTDGHDSAEDEEYDVEIIRRALESLPD